MFNVTDLIVFDHSIINPYNIYTTRTSFIISNYTNDYLLAPILLTKILPTHI